MATTLSGKAVMSLNITSVKALDGRSASDPVSDTKTANFANGTGAAQGNKTARKQYTLAQSASVDVDLSGDATFKDAFGDAVTFTKVKAIRITNNSVASTLIFGGDANSLPLFVAAADGIVLRPGASLQVQVSDLDSTGYTVTGGTGDILQFTHGGEDAAALTFDLTIVGVG